MGLSVEMLTSARYHNYEQYLSQWTSNIDSGNGSALLKERPRPIGMLYDNTTVIGSWIHTDLNSTDHSKTDRVINNVSMAMPHAGVLSAARDPLNNLIQPQDLDVSMRADQSTLHPSSWSSRVLANM